MPSVLACFLARAEACIATGRKQLSTHPHVRAKPCTWTQRCQGAGVRWLYLLKGPHRARKEPAKTTQPTKIQVAANGTISASYWLSPSLHTPSLFP